MGKPTVAQLSERVEQLESNAANVFVASGTVWDADQLGHVIEKYSRYGELVKMELTINHSVGKDAYHYIIWHYKLLNREQTNE